MNEPARVAVIGAGLGGLALAAALARADIACEVFEQARELTEVGAGVQLAPNAARVLRRLGLEPAEHARAVRIDATEIRRWDDDRLLHRTALGSWCEEEYGAPYYAVHRAHLQAALKDMVGPGRIHLGRRVVRVDQPDQLDEDVRDIGDIRESRETPLAGVRLRFADGGTEEAEVAVGADGIHSAVRGTITRDEPVYSGQTIYRGLVPISRLPSSARESRVRVWAGPGRHCVCYPVAADPTDGRGTMVSFAATVPAGEWPAESWTALGSPAELAKAYEGWNAEVRALIEAADVVRLWALHDREPLPRWSAGRLTLLGDAAHPMLPFLAQGANQAVEDAAGLAACLAGVGVAEVPAALRRYERLRAPRTAEIQREARAGTGLLHLPDGGHQRDRDRAMAGGTRFGSGSGSRPSGHRLYEYDVERAAEHLLV